MSGEHSGDFSGDGRTIELNWEGVLNKHDIEYNIEGLDPSLGQNYINALIDSREHKWWCPDPQNPNTKIGTSWFDLNISQVNNFYFQFVIKIQGKMEKYRYNCSYIGCPYRYDILLNDNAGLPECLKVLPWPLCY